MSKTTPHTLKHLATLAAIAVDESELDALSRDITQIMDYVESLKHVETESIQPLSHPFDLHQRLRADVVTETDAVAELDAIATQFDDHFYWVPKVIDTEHT